MARVVLGAALLLPAFSLVGAGGALAAAAPGTLTYQGCISEPGGDLCGTQGYGLAGPRGMTLSPDGADLYLAGKDLTTLTRAAGGGLGFSSCLRYAADSETQCAASTNLAGPNAVAVSPDGKNVYVLDSGLIDIYARGSAGALSYQGCVGDAGESTYPGPCATRVPGMSLEGGGGAGAITVTGDGNYLYTAAGAGGGSNGAIDAFRRAGDGSLTPLGCIGNQGGSGQGCAANAPGLQGAGSIAISDAGYMFVGTAGAIVSLKLAADGTLATVGCIGSVSGCAPASNMQGANSSAEGIALSQDGSTLYAAEGNSHALQELSVSGGVLTPFACMGGTGVSGCTTDTTVYSCPTGVVVSRDDADVYVTDHCAQALMTFSRAGNGALSYDSCLAENGAAAACAGYSPGLASPAAIVITPDDGELIVAGTAGNSLATFARVPTPPQITIGSPAPGATYQLGQAVYASYACAAVTGGATPSSCVGTVANGAAVDTSSPGVKTFTVTVTDTTGVQSSQSVSYTVVAPALPPSATLTVAGFKQSHSRWTERRHRGRHATPYGTVFSFDLSAPAQVTLTFARLGRHHAAKVVGHLRFGGRAGVNHVDFRGRVGRQTLKTGGYRVTLTVASAAARTASVKSLEFTILR